MTKPDKVYLVRNTVNGFCKIGASGVPKKRLINLQSSNSENLELLSYVEVSNAFDIESNLHKWFVHKKVKGEWFNLNQKDIASFKERALSMNAVINKVRTSSKSKKSSLKLDAKKQSAEAHFSNEVAAKNKEAHLNKLSKALVKEAKVRVNTFEDKAKISEFLKVHLTLSVKKALELTEKVKQKYRDRSNNLAAAGAFSVYHIPAFMKAVKGAGSSKLFTLTVTPGLARDLLKANHQGEEGLNRNLSANRVLEYAIDMVRNNWVDNIDPVIIDKNGFIISAAHRLEAIVMSGKTIRLLFSVGADTGSCYVIDSGRPRSVSDRICRPGTNGRKISQVSSFLLKVAYPSKKRFAGYLLEHVCSIIEDYHDEVTSAPWAKELYRIQAVKAAYIVKMLLAKNQAEQRTIQRNWRILNLNCIDSNTAAMNAFRSFIANIKPNVFEVSRQIFLKTLTVLTDEHQNEGTVPGLDKFDLKKVAEDLRKLIEA